MKEQNDSLILCSKLYKITDKVIQVILYGSDNYRSALITHYLSSRDRKLKKQAYQYTKEILVGYIPDHEIDDQLVEEAVQQFFSFDDVPFRKPAYPKFTFIDLFAGIGGFRIAMQAHQGECVFSSEWDKYAQRTYYANFGEIPFGDITKDETKRWIPENFDILCGGFPCQPFSIAGVSKKISLGRSHGFDDEKQGNLFSHIADILENHRPKAYFLENVKNLVSHDKGNTFKAIKEKLESLNYSFHWKVMNGKIFVPQNRERTFMVGFDKNIYKGQEKFKFPELISSNKKFKDILETKKVDKKYTLSNHLWKYLQDYAQKHKEKGNGFGFGLTDLNGISRTMSARYYKDGSEILIPQKDNNPRRLTEREAANLQGYPDHYIINAVSMNQSYKQFGNSVVVPLIEAIGENIITTLLSKIK